MDKPKLPVPLGKWVSFKTRFKIEKSRSRDAHTGEDREQYRLVIEFPRKYRIGYYPFELQLRDGQSRGLTNYWVNPFGVEEIKRVIEAIELLTRDKPLSIILPKLRRALYKVEAFQRAERQQSRSITKTNQRRQSRT